MPNKVIRSKSAPAPIGPYSQAILSGNTLFCSGQIPIDPSSGELNMENLSIETHQVMQNLRMVLEEAGMQFTDVVKCSIFLKDMGDFAEVNAIYGEYFDVNPPARETVQVARLPLDVNVEISLIAIKNS
jgi:2-iminobutanoate/2-iminopropanoate deaminase